MNKLFEVYSKGLYQSLNSDEVAKIKQDFEAIASSEDIKSLKIFFINYRNRCCIYNFFFVSSYNESVV